MDRLCSPTWIVPGKVLACPYSSAPEPLSRLAREGVGLCVNLHERALEPAWLLDHGLVELHLPVPDFTAPSPEVLSEAVAAIDRSLSDGRAVAVNCGAGLGRTGTVVACWLVRQGRSPEDAIALVRERRPGSIETAEQERAVHEFAQTTRLKQS